MEANLRPDAFVGTAEAYARWRPPYPPALLTDLLREARIGAGARLLDLATGPGRIALALAGDFAEVWAQDLEPEMIAAARAAAAERGVDNVSWSVGAAEELEAPAGGFDLITIGEAFHRLDQRRIAGKARRWLKPGGGLATLGGANLLEGKRPWQVALRALVLRFTEDAFPHGWGQARAGVEPGREPAMRAVAEAGFTLVADRTFTTAQALSFEAVLGHLHSTSVASRRVLGDNAGALAEALKAALAPFAGPDGLIREETSFGYTLFRNPDGGRASGSRCRRC